MNTRLPRLLALSSVLVAAFVVSTQEAHATLLTYWNFNNVSPAYNGSGSPGILGSFSTTPNGTYGETYTPNATASTGGTLSSNTANSTVFNGSGIKIDFSNLATVSSPIINGKSASSSYANQADTFTTFGGYGVFTDSTVNRAGTDTTTGGALIIMNPSGAEQTHYITFALSSAGYNALVFTYSTRASSGTASQIWSYSLDGTNFSGNTTINPTVNGTFNTQTLNLSTISATALDNQDTFYLRMTINNGASSSYAFDNFQLNGTAISAVPEPSTYSLLGGAGVLGLALFSRRKRG
jgi:hypothetical protein